jgi:hypothetical protein
MAVLVRAIEACKLLDLATATLITTRRGTLRLLYHDTRQPPSIFAIAATAAGIGALAACAQRAVGLSGEVDDAWTVVDLVRFARFLAMRGSLPREQNDLQQWERASVLAAGARSFVDSGRYFQARNQDEAVSFEQRSQKAWPPSAVEVALDARVTQISMHSPVEIVIVMLLGSAAAVNSFAILAGAVRRVNRNVRGLGLDNARINAEIAQLHADRVRSESEMEVERAQRTREHALVDIDRITPGGLQLTLDEMEVTIDDG